MTVLEIISYYLMTMNLMGFLFMGADKWKAKKRAWRIPEATLLLIAALGGAAGALIGQDTGIFCMAFLPCWRYIS